MLVDHEYYTAVAVLSICEPREAARKWKTMASAYGGYAAEAFVVPEEITPRNMILAAMAANDAAWDRHNDGDGPGPASIEFDCWGNLVYGGGRSRVFITRTGRSGDWTVEVLSTVDSLDAIAGRIEALGSEHVHISNLGFGPANRNIGADCWTATEVAEVVRNWSEDQQS